MTDPTPLNVTTTPADGTDRAHTELRAWLDELGLPPGDAEWIEATYATTDVDGAPTGLATVRAASITNCHRRT